MRAIFCGNFDYDAPQSCLENLFRMYGKVCRFDMKSGFAFVYMEDESHAEKAIKELDQVAVGRKDCRIHVRWAKPEYNNDGISRQQQASRKSWSDLRPSKTLFVIHFDQNNTTARDLERHFSPYGKILNVRIKKNYAFVQYESQEDATKALHATNNSKLLNYIISVEFGAVDNCQDGYNPDQTRDWSYHKRGYDEVRSLSPYKRARSADDYGYIRSPCPQKERSDQELSTQGPTDGSISSFESPCPQKERSADKELSTQGPTNGSMSSFKSPCPQKERSADQELSTQGPTNSSMSSFRSSCPQKERSADQGLSTQGPTNGSMSSFGISRQRETFKRPCSDLRPSKTLFVIHFDQNNTTTRDLERHFSPYGKILSVKIKNNYAFVQYESQEDATKALHATNNSKLLNYIIYVQYAIDNCRNGFNPDQTRDWSYHKRGYDEVRSLSPCKRDRSADYYRPCPQKERSADLELSTQGPTNGPMSAFRISRPRETLRKSWSDYRPSKTLFVIHFDQNNTTTGDLERHFNPYGKILSVKIKNNYAFVQYESQEDATRAFHATNNSKLLNYVISVDYAAVDNWRNDQPWSHKKVYEEGRSLSPCKRERGPDCYGHTQSPCPQSTSQELSTQGSRQRENFRKSCSDLKPSKTLFVIHFDLNNTRRRDLERHFSPYGKILSIKIKNSYAFVQYESQEDATKALHATNNSKLLNCIISVEYSAVDNCRSGYNPDQTSGWSHKKVYEETRPLSPWKRERSPRPQKERSTDQDPSTQV